MSRFIAAGSPVSNAVTRSRTSCSYFARVVFGPCDWDWFRAAGNGPLQRDPAFFAELAGDGVLNVTEAGFGRRSRKRMEQPLARRRILAAKRSQPALDFTTQVVEGTQWTPSFRYAWCPLASGRKKDVPLRTRMGGSRALAADRRHPTAR